jgi:hypothetical protein
VGERRIVAQVSGERLAELRAGTPVRVELRPVPVALAG